MRYNPATDRARSIDDLAAESRQAIAKQGQSAMDPAQAKKLWAKWARDGHPNRSFNELSALFHGANVAEAMGNRSRGKTLFRMALFAS